jgi:DNA mismatch endonuclease Vsr
MLRIKRITISWSINVHDSAGNSSFIIVKWNFTVPDQMSKEQRSRLMACVHARNTKFELSLLRILSAELYPLGYRYRKHYRRVLGTPDIVFVKHRIAVFLDSDFWHGRNYDLFKKTMSPFWRIKIEANIERDRHVNMQLRREGWTVLRFGEKQVRKRPTSVVRRIKVKLGASC